MDLREAIRWCYENEPKKLNVNSKRGSGPSAIRFSSDRGVEAYAMGEWLRVSGWWDELTDPSTTFSIPEEKPSEEEIF